MYQYDVAIIGGGPAGSSLAFLLQKQGISCCVIDRERFPREKLCGGLLTEKTVRLINSIYGNVDFPYERESSSVSIFWGNDKLSNISTKSKFYLVERRKFDHYLFEQYKKIGGKVFEGEKIKKIDMPSHTIELQLGKTIKYNILVGADGANSYVRKLINPDYKPNAICVESSFASDMIRDEISVFFLDCRSGYAWCFPKKDYYCIGMGGDTQWNKGIKETFIHFSGMIEKPIERHSVRGAMIPFGRYVKTPYDDKENILLIGDAAGLVDPITGEGLYFAFLSAKFAESAIVKRILENKLFEKTYGKDITNIHRIIKNANLFNSTFFSRSAKKRLIPLLKNRKNMLEYYCNNILSEYTVPYMRFPFKYIGIWMKKKIERVC